MLCKEVSTQLGLFLSHGHGDVRKRVCVVGGRGSMCRGVCVCVCVCVLRGGGYELERGEHVGASTFTKVTYFCRVHVAVTKYVTRSHER